jgi:Ca2+/Na+ antiporter
VAVARRHGTEPSSRRSLAFLAVSVVVAAGTVVLIPQTPTWNVVRFVLGALCLVPFFLSLKALRGVDPDPRVATAT